MNETTERQRFRMALLFEPQRQAFDLLTDQGFPVEQAFRICRNPRNFGLRSNFAELKQALVNAGFWDRLYNPHDVSAAVG